MDVSIIIPVYNDEGFLRECLDSVLTQSGCEIEIVCIDDGSTDKSSEILRDYAGRDSRLRVIRQENKGLSAARNRGIEEATGRYVLFVDSDDALASGAVESLVRLADAENLDQVIFGVDVYKDQGVTSVDDLFFKREKDYFAVKDGSVFHRICSGHEMCGMLINCDSFYVSVCSRIFRRELFTKRELRFLEGIIHEDNLFTPLAMMESQRITIIPDQLYKRRLRDGSIVTSSRLEKRIVGLLICVMKLRSLKFDEKRAIETYITYLYRKIWFLLLQYSGEVSKEQIIMETERIIGAEDAMVVADVVFPLLKLVDEMHARAQKYRDKRLSSRLKRLLCRMARKEVRTMDESKKAIKVSVIVPVYNAERYLRQALDSLAAQTLSDVEFICIDDGSRDASGAILDEYFAKDRRFRVFHTVNQGAANARNFGMAQACGEYLTFMDADDYVEPFWLEEVYGISKKNKLDICISDFEMFSESTGETLCHWWTLKNQANNLVFNKVVSPRRLRKWAVAGNVWSCLFNRQFIMGNGFRFFKIRPADDAHFLYSAMIRAKRIYFHPVVYLHYRRGMEMSAVAQYGKNFESQKDCLLEISLLRKNIGGGFFKSSMIKAFIWRFMHDVLYAAENISKMAEWIADGGLADSLRIETLRKRDIGKNLMSRIKRLQECFKTSLERPKEVEKLVDEIEAARFGKKKDLYIITGQLNSKTNEPIDSWTFFRYLQSKGVPSRYVIWRKHYFLKEIKKQGLMKDVIVLRGNGVKNFEFLKKCRKELVRAKAVVQENGAIERFTAQWLRELPGCEYVFLQHGISYLWLSKSVAGWVASAFNTINVPSEREKSFWANGFSSAGVKEYPRFAIGGLPRWDLLKDTSVGEPEKIVFVMMTWRSIFNAGMDILKKSDYYHGLKALLSKENLEKMREMGLRVVWAPHHHMANRIKDLDFEFGDMVEVAKTSEISKWIARSSMCITDFSSVSGDFLFLNKPVVYWVPDRDDPLLDPEEGNAGAKVKSACENLEKWFNVAMSEEDVMDYVRHYRKNGFVLEDAKREMASGLFAHKENICEKIHQALEV